VSGRASLPEVPAGLGAVENDLERISAVLEERSAKPLAELGVDLRLGHEGTQHIDDLRVAAEGEAIGEKRTEVSA
jgi:hypothetical protein